MQNGSDRFLDAAWRTFDFLAEFPGSGRRYNSTKARLKTLRVWRIAGFPNVLVFYRFTSKSLNVVRVLHGARGLRSLLGW